MTVFVQPVIDAFKVAESLYVQDDDFGHYLRVVG